MRNDYGDLIAKWKVRLIRTRAKKFFFRTDEIPDLEQIIVPQLLQLKFAPDRPNGAAEKTFVVAVIDRRLKMIKRARQRDIRRANHETQSLDDPMVTEKSHLGRGRSDAMDLRLDLESALIGLTPTEQRICRALSEGFSQADIARATGRSKAAISGEVKKLREKFRQWGLGAYAGATKKTGFPPERFRENGK